jgi:preprotein translocase subunit YajC
LSILIFLADTVQPAVSTTGGSDAAPAWFKIFGNQFFPLILGLVVLMWLMSRFKNTKDKTRLDMLKQLKRGDRIQTIGGILGTVLRTEENRVEVKVDEANNTKMWFTRSAIHQVIEEEKVKETAK